MTSKVRMHVVLGTEIGGLDATGLGQLRNRVTPYVCDKAGDAPMRVNR
jgi:hypothetical protein